MGKDTSLSEATLNSKKKNKYIALAIVKSEGIGQAGRQAVSQSVSRKFC